MKTWQEISGWFDEDGPMYGANLYRRIVAELPGRNESAPLPVFVELGCWVGKSTACMLTLLREAGRHDVRVCVYDNFTGCPRDVTSKLAQGRDLLREFEENLAACGFESCRDYYLDRCDSAAAAEHWQNEGVDFVYNDAEHSREAVSENLAAWWPKIKPGGIAAGHDYPENGVADGVREFAAPHGLTIETTDPMNWLIRKPMEAAT